MAEKRVIFSSDRLGIEGLYNDVSGDRGVVVAHPHHLHGGDMMNNVVEALCLAYEVINGADHFYWGKTEDIRKIIKDFITRA